MSAAAPVRSTACSRAARRRQPDHRDRRQPVLAASEADALAAEEGLAGRDPLSVPGNAEALPFPDAAFGCVFSVTVLEECDADRAIAEMIRVARPGGRIGDRRCARSTCRNGGTSTCPRRSAARSPPPPRSVARNGVADASLYRRMRRAGLADLVSYPFLITLDQPDGPIWRYREDHVLSLLTQRSWRCGTRRATRPQQTAS